MLLAFSILGFALAFGLFVYFFDHFMGASDTADLADVMSGIQDNDLAAAPKKNKKLSAATGR
jgi:hypothetical protein